MEPIGAFVKCNQVWWEEETEQGNGGQGWKLGMWTAWGLPKSLWSISCEGTKNSPSPPPTPWGRLFWKCCLHKPKPQMRSFINPTICFPGGGVQHEHIKPYTQKSASHIHKFSKMPWGQILLISKRHSSLYVRVNYGAITYSSALF